MRRGRYFMSSRYDLMLAVKRAVELVQINTSMARVRRRVVMVEVILWKELFEKCLAFVSVTFPGIRVN
jgi:hypothetical protein